jgi:GMP synthase (glutamine-hydrolysing)
MAGSKTCAAIGHVLFEDLGLLKPLLQEKGYDIQYIQAGVDRIDTAQLVEPSLLVILGGPIGVYETDAYPFLSDEISAIKARLAADRPMLGVCLGAQLMAAALGARVAPGPGKGIGWGAVTLTTTGTTSVLAPLAEAPVLHWHGDNCELPEGCTRLAFTDRCPVQAFHRAPHQLGLQFHLETEAARFERWLVGHTVELGKAGIDPSQLRAQARAHGAAAAQVGRKVLSSWLASIDRM